MFISIDNMPLKQKKNKKKLGLPFFTTESSGWIFFYSTRLSTTRFPTRFVTLQITKKFEAN